MNARADRFPLFDSLRAIGALAVVLFHAAFFARLGSSEGWLRPYTAHLDVGVTIFFLVSGFLLYRPFVRARLRGEPLPATGAYAWRRLLRIAPAYWVALTVVTLWLGLPEVFTAVGIPTFYGFAQIYSAATSVQGIGQAWTLCVEVTFYAFLPLWALLIHRLARGRPARGILSVELAGLALLFAGSVAYKVFALMQVAPSSLESAPWLMPLPNFLDQFALGMGLAVLSAWYEERESRPAPLRLVERFPAAAWALALAAFWAVSTQIGYTGETLQQATSAMFLERHMLYAAVAFGVILPAVFGDPRRGLVRRLLANRVLLYLGLVSYGIYLYHFAAVVKIEAPLAEAVGGGPALRFALLALAGTAAATALASLSYYVVERPALALKRLVGPRPVPARDEAVAEPAPVAPVTAPRA